MRNEYIEKKPIYLTEEWKVTEPVFDETVNKRSESVFTTANGYIGIRGYIDEGFDNAKDETASPQFLLNGVYEYYNVFPEPFRPGFPSRCHRILKQINPLNVKVIADGETVKLSKKDYSRSLDFKTGVSSHSYVYTTKGGKNVKIEYKRFAYQCDKNLAYSMITVSADKDVEISFKSVLNKSFGYEEVNKEFDKWYQGITFEEKEGLSVADYGTKVSRFDICCAIKEECGLKKTTSVSEEGIISTFDGKLKAKEEISLYRTIGYSSTRDVADYKNFIINKVLKAETYEQALENNVKDLNDFWNYSDIKIDKDEIVQQGVRFSALQVYMSAGRDGITNISANGLTGDIYQGHSFWDTEMYMLSEFTFGKQEVAKKLLTYRYNILDKSRERAVQMEDQGALYSWNTINGEECGIYHEASHAQYHINTDIGYAIESYFDASNDEDFLVNMGAEMLFEMSRCIAHRGSFCHTKGKKYNKFVINVICGPDEYNPIVDNNLYTNLLAKRMFDFTLKTYDLLKKKYPDKFKALVEKCKMTDEEVALIKKASDNMYFPYNDEYQMYMQDDNFMYKDEISLDDIPANKLPLLGTMHPLNLWRWQICKQADLVLATFICSDFFKKDEIKKIFEYYEPKTIHDSSLSAAIHSIVACAIGKQNDAYKYVKHSSRMDLDDVNRNTSWGLHAACMGGARMLIVNGYAGLRVFGGKLHFEPAIYDNWNSYSFKVNYKGNVLQITVNQDSTIYELESGNGLTISHFGKDVKVGKEKAVVKNEK